METPSDRRYTEQHEWALEVEGRIRVGISDYAQDALGDIVYVDLPEVGAEFEAGDTIAEVESTKSVAEVYAPVSGTIAASNEALAETPELVNSSPYGDGWFVEIDPAEGVSLDGLLDADGYQALTD